MSFRIANADTDSTCKPADPQGTDQAIKSAFLKLDKEIMEQSAAAITGPSFLNEAMSKLAPAYSGSCALISYYHSESHVLKVACTGDSRAVLGRRNAAGEWEAIALSSDQVRGSIFTLEKRRRKSDFGALDSL